MSIVASFKGLMCIQFTSLRCKVLLSMASQFSAT